MSELNENFVRDMLACTDPEGRNQHASLTVWEEHQLAYGWLHLQTLRLQLSRAKEWMEHKLTCPSGGDRPMSDDLCGCGLTEFLKEVGEE